MAVLLGLFLAGATVAHAQGRAPVAVRTAGGEVTVLADRLEQVGGDNLLVASGNVEITRGRSRLIADRVERGGTSARCPVAPDPNRLYSGVLVPHRRRAATGRRGR